MSADSKRLDLRASEQLRSVVENLVATVAATAFASSTLLYLLRATVAEPVGIIWLVLLNCVGVARLSMLWLYRSHTPDDPRNRTVMNMLTACALVSGLIWSASVWALGAPEQYHLQVVVMFACLAIATGGAFGTVASLRTAYSIFIPPVLAPFAFSLFHDDRYYRIVGVMSLVYGLILARMIYMLNSQFRYQISVREENQSLLGELRRRTVEAETANEAKSRFLIAASHDLRQPMQAIVLRARALSDLELPPEAKTSAVRLDDAIATMLDLFDRLLDVSQLEAHAIVPQVTPFALQPLFARLEESYRDLAWQDAIELKVEASELWVSSDALMLERILRQLLDNALRHAIRRSVALSAHRVDAGIAIEVRDTGPGIPRDKQEDIFKEFVQLNNPQRDRRMGLGLGLAIADRLARLLGHRLQVESEVGQGAAFRVIVPAAKAGTAARPALPPDKDPAALQGLLVAVLDDTPDVLEALGTMLRRWRCETIVATNSEVLTNALRGSSRKPDVLICDYRLAESCTGIEVILALRNELGINCPALLITGDVAMQQDKELSVTGITVMQKPVRAAQLRSTLATFRQRSQPD
ncbi:MAG: ATP-binding protein [Rudaea sp.]|nr:ATP-binding protein [Rudaea sp.]